MLIQTAVHDSEQRMLDYFLPILESQQRAIEELKSTFRKYNHDVSVLVNDMTTQNQNAAAAAAAANGSAMADAD